MIGGFDRRKTLQDLEHDDWGQPPYDSHLVTTCHTLRRKPLCDLTIEDLRILIGQRVGLSYLVPIAVEVLECDPLAAGDFYPGDLLAAVTAVDDDFWKAHLDSLSRIRSVINRVSELLPTLDKCDRTTLTDVLERSAAFLREGV